MSALVFGLFPWSYEAMLRSAAVYNSLIHACGLGALLLTAVLFSYELAVLCVPLAGGAAQQRCTVGACYAVRGVDGVDGVELKMEKKCSSWGDAHTSRCHPSYCLI